MHEGFNYLKEDITQLARAFFIRCAVNTFCHICVQHAAGLLFSNEIAVLTNCLNDKWLCLTLGSSSVQLYPITKV